MKGETPQTPREELEVRLTALLMGELPPEQAAALEAQIAADAELRSLHARLREAVELVREASTIREQPAPAMLVRLSKERRERLLKLFKSDVPPAVHTPPRRDWSWVLPLSLAAGLIALIGGGLLFDGSLSNRSRSTGNKNVVFDSEGTHWESQPFWKERAAGGEDRSGTKWLYVLQDGTIGPASRATEKNPEVGRTAFWTDDDAVKYAVASPPTATDLFGDAKRGEGAQRPWYLAWAGQASPSNSPESDGGRAQPSTGVLSNDIPALFAAAPTPPASAALPALEPAARPTSASAPMPLAAIPAPPASSPVPAREPASGPSAVSTPRAASVLAGIEPSLAARGGGEGSVAATDALHSAFGASRERALNESKSDFDAGIARKSATLAENGELPQLGALATTGGLFGSKPAQIAGQQPAGRAPDSQPTAEMLTDRIETYAFRLPESGDKAQRVESQDWVTLQDMGAEGEVRGLNRSGLALEKAKGQTALGEATGFAGGLPAIREDGVDGFVRSKDLKDHAGAGVELKLDASSGVTSLAKNFVDLNAPDAPDRMVRFYSEKEKLGKAIEAAPEAKSEARLAQIAKKTDDAKRSLSTRVDDLAKLEALKTAPEQVKQELTEQLKEVVEEEVTRRAKLTAAVPQPEVQTRDNRFSTFSLNVSDVAFKLAAASLENGTMPEPAAIRSEEFINAFDYRDPEPARGVRLAFASERARYPFAQNRDLLRISVKTAAAGRQPGRALNVVLLVDNSGSMERADRVRILHEALRVLAGQLQPQDKLSIITFARTPRLWVDGVAGDKAGEATARISEITPQGGTNLSAALELGYQTALRHYQVQSVNRVVLLTDGAANLGNVNAAALKEKVEAHRKQGVALDCFGIGWEGYNDDLLEVLSRNGDGRYGFINTAEEAATVFVAQLAGALRVAASDVKVQVEFNPRRVTAYRQVGYAKHQLTKEQFRDNTVDAAEIGAAEAGNGIYVVEVNPRGEGDLATVRVRFKLPGTATYREQEWTVPFTTHAPPLEQASLALRLAGSASAFSEWLAASPYAGEVTPDALLGYLNGVPNAYGADPRPKKLEWMIRQAKSLSGR